MMAKAGMVEGLLLIALALGYIVLYLANREEKVLRSLGFAVGIFAIALSGILILNNIVGGKFCKMGMGKPYPMMQKPVIEK